MNENLEVIRVGLIGYGFAGKTFHVPLIRSVPGLALTVVGSGRPEIVHADLPRVTVCSAVDVATHPDVDLVVIAKTGAPELGLHDVQREWDGVRALLARRAREALARPPLETHVARRPVPTGAS